MTIDEFEAGATEWESLAQMDRTAAIAAACRGSGNPAALAWIAEALEVGPDTVVVDVGAGLGGAAAWLTDHFRCRVITIDPVHEAARCASTVFDLPATVASGDRLPLRDGVADCAIVLGVLSVVDDPVAVLVEARRIARRLAVLAYLSTTASPVRCGGSTFRTGGELSSEIERSGWMLRTAPISIMEQPPTWESDNGSDTDDPAEAAVGDALAAGLIGPYVVVAS